MNDRELLEMAAKACCIDLVWCDAWKGMAKWVNVVDGFDYDSLWRPLSDDGDAIRLAVKLSMLLDVDNEAGIVTAVIDGKYNTVKNIVHVESLLDCNYGMAATRRAIVRAAAEIGKSVQ